MIPRYESSVCEQVDGNTDSLQIAACAVALGIPFDKNRFITTANGEGIKNTRAIFHFSGSSPEGNTIQALVKVWSDMRWLDANAKTEVAMIKKAFKAMFDMADQSTGKKGEIYPKKTKQDTIYTASTAAAATLVGLGHPCYGYTKHAGSYFWHFDRMASSDLALWNDKNIHMVLPDSPVSYVKCALLNWKVLINEVSQRAEFTAIQHKGRTAYVHKNDDAKTQSKLEQLLYRK